MNKNLFSLWTPFETIEKAEGRTRHSPNGGDEEVMVGRIGGVISAETRDFQGETLFQKGLDWSYFLQYGWLNYEHAKGPENVLGHPESVTPTVCKGKPATKLEGVLYLHNARARDIYRNAQAMEKAGNERRLGFSVEGQVQERFGKEVRRARVLNVAVTAHPVNPDARLEVLAKSLDGGTMGYQHPAVPAAGAPLSPLVPQSLEDTPSVATFARYAMEERRMGIPELATLLTNTFPYVPYDKAIRIAKEIARVVG